MEHQAGEGDEVQPGHGLWQPLVILDQPPKPRRPRERAFHYPSARQQHEAALGLRAPHHLKPNAASLGIALRLLPRIALINVSQLDVLASRLLDRGDQCLYPLPILLVGRGNVQGEQRCPRVSTAAWTFEPRLRLAPS